MDQFWGQYYSQCIPAACHVYFMLIMLLIIPMLMTQIYLKITNTADSKSKIESVVSDTKIWVKKLKLIDKTEILLVYGNRRVHYVEITFVINTVYSRLQQVGCIRNFGASVNSRLNY